MFLFGQQPEPNLAQFAWILAYWPIGLALLIFAMVKAPPGSKLNQLAVKFGLVSIPPIAGTPPAQPAQVTVQPAPPQGQLVLPPAASTLLMPGGGLPQHPIVMAMLEVMPTVLSLTPRILSILDDQAVQQAIADVIKHQRQAMAGRPSDNVIMASATPTPPAPPAPVPPAA